MDTPGNLLSAVVTGGKEQERHQAADLTNHLQSVADGSVEVAVADQGYTGSDAAEAAREHGVELEVVRTPEARRGFVLSPRCWVVERAFGWLARHRRLARDYERLADTPAAFHRVAFLGILLTRIPLAGSS